MSYSSILEPCAWRHDTLVVPQIPHAPGVDKLGMYDAHVFVSDAQHLCEAVCRRLVAVMDTTRTGMPVSKQRIHVEEIVRTQTSSAG